MNDDTPWGVINVITEYVRSEHKTNHFGLMDGYLRL